MRLQDGADHVESRYEPALVDVNAVVTDALLTGDSRKAQEALLHTALAATFGAYLEETMSIIYRFEWDPVTMKMIWKCINENIFSVDFGSEGTVLVVLTQSMLLK